jgi:hypothetical protein
MNYGYMDGDPEFATTRESDGVEFMTMTLSADETLAVFVLQHDGTQYSRIVEGADPQEVIGRLRELANEIEERL